MVRRDRRAGSDQRGAWRADRRRAQAGVLRRADTQPNIPNCSYTGYRAGERPLPSPPVVANVRDFGATGNGQTNDTAAFEAALEKAGRSGGAVLVPAGTYVLTNVLRLVRSGVVLRGEGADRSILAFDRSLSDVLGRTERAGWRDATLAGRDRCGAGRTHPAEATAAPGRACGPRGPCTSRHPTRLCRRSGIDPGATSIFYLSCALAIWYSLPCQGALP